MYVCICAFVCVYLVLLEERNIVVAYYDDDDDDDVYDAAADVRRFRKKIYISLMRKIYGHLQERL